MEFGMCHYLFKFFKKNSGFKFPFKVIIFCFHPSGRVTIVMKLTVLIIIADIYGVFFMC